MCMCNCTFKTTNYLPQGTKNSANEITAEMLFEMTKTVQISKLNIY